MKRLFLLSLLFLTLSCSSEDDFISDIYKDSIETLHDDQSNNPVSRIEVGRLNAVKKAYQMTDIVFTPLHPIEANTLIYVGGEEYRGMIYSSVKEIGTYVGSNVSFHTFMTAIHNPRSKIYTERIDEAPYHGVNCKAYYGTVCSALVSYALGIDYGSYDFPVSELMEEVDYSNIDNIHIADVLWKSGHVALITNILRDRNNHVKKVEISEAIESGCTRYTISDTHFISIMNSSFKKIYRYKEIYNNTDYTPVPEFVSVLGETSLSFRYNNDLCVDKGDMACYRENENVIINIMHDYDYLEIFKDNDLYLRLDAGSEGDIVLQNLSYGDYKACICDKYGQTISDYTQWKVVNIELSADNTNNRLYFKSSNAIPYLLFFTDIRGSRTYPHTELYFHKLTPEDISNGFIEIPRELTKKNHPYIHFLFSTEYGKIQNNPFNWFK